jgi:hypothetical protein
VLPLVRGHEYPNLGFHLRPDAPAFAELLDEVLIVDG